MDSSICLNSNLALAECTGLNIEGSDSTREVFGNGGTVKSNAGDPELIVIAKFLSPVNISGIRISGGMDSSKNPETIALYVNNSSLSFSDLDGVKATETFNVSDKLGKNISLKVAKFRNVHTLAVNLSNNLDSCE
jgi:hypothetical protein